MITIIVKYVDFNSETKCGEITCNKSVYKEIINIFSDLYDLKFPIFSIIPISEFNNDDFESVKNNNTSCYNFRNIIGSNKLSDHALGLAIDINPMQNPWLHPKAHKIEGRRYDTEAKGTVNDDVVKIFKKYGWEWGGNWSQPDYQHFYKSKSRFLRIYLSIKRLFIFSS